MLDKLSKDILRYMTEKENCHKEYNFGTDIEEIAEALVSDEDAVRNAVRFLKDTGYIQYVGLINGNFLWFKLGHKGLHWKEYRRMEILQYLKEKWAEILAALAALATVVLTVLMAI